MNNKGFTVLELIVSIIILCLIAVVFISSALAI